jgi:Fe-S cluster assembly protein SufB
MATETSTIQALAETDYKWGFVSAIKSDAVPPGLNEDIIRHISARKNEPTWLLDFRQGLPQVVDDA